MDELRHISTACIHAGEAPDPYTGAVVPPIYQTTTFAFGDSEGIERYMEGEEVGYMYSRYGNPTLTVLEEKMAALEGGESALCVASGNAATTITILLCAKAGDHVVCTRDVYGGTYSILTELATRAGISTTFVDTSDPADVEAAVRPNTKLIFIETPTNPTIRISHIEHIAKIAHSRGIRLAVDNTFATPYNQNPIELGADIVTHSMTKFLNGHSDVTGGVIVGRADDIVQCRELMKQMGASLNPFDAWLVIRGLKTLSVRMERHNGNAIAVAEFLSSHPAVERVLYPGLPDHPEYILGRTQMRGSGGILSFIVKGGYDGARKVIDGVDMAMRAVSLGSVETLITQPAATSHRCMPKEYREKAGIVDGLIRLSVGIEDVLDIIADLENALSALK